MNNKELWKEERINHDLKYPDEDVVRFLFSNFKNKNGINVMDFGCGSGRNTRVLADLGLNIYAMDYNQECIELTRKKIKGYKNVHYLVNLVEHELPLDDKLLDGIVACGALFYLNSEKEKLLLKELNRVMKDQAMIFADYRTVEDSLFGCGKEIDKNMFILDKSCGALAGISYVFKEKEELFQLYHECGFDIVNFEKVNRYTNNMRELNSHYIIWGKKVCNAKFN